MKQLVYLLIVFFFNSTFSQENYGIHFPSEREQTCYRFNEAFFNRPKEVQFSIQREGDKLYLVTNDKVWFSRLFKASNDGIALDIVLKDRYNCSLEDIENTQIRGELLRPIYTSKLKSGLKPYQQNSFRVEIGILPGKYRNEDIEANILFLSNNSLCQYYVIYDLKSYPWDLLDMGMYLDSLTFSDNKIKPMQEGQYEIKYKTLKFTIPFQKNKAEYSQEDIKPLYDSLRLTDFNIKSINIKAYSSVEGSLERNIELQEQRANSIANALQTFQNESIKTEISSSENWVEFLNDIEGTSYEGLSKLSKSGIKNKLASSNPAEMENILKNHRKAVVTLQLEKKDFYENMSEGELLVNFNNAISSENLEEASKIQNSIFEKLKNKEISPNILDRMEIPKQQKFVQIFNKNSAHRYLLDIKNLLIAYNEMLELEKMSPKDKRVKYNLTVMKIKLWRYNALPVDENKLKKQIDDLKSYGISSKLLDRMRVNFHIIKSEQYMRERDYANKDKSVDYIKSKYRNFPFSDYDYLSLSQFLSHYSNVEDAAELLKYRVKSLEVDEDLLFYYLNLTIIDHELTNTSDYRTMMLNAISMDKPRFCRLFNAFGKGGVTFQLLEDDYLRDAYCENCND